MTYKKEVYIPLRGVRAIDKEQFQSEQRDNTVFPDKYPRSTSPLPRARHDSFGIPERKRRGKYVVVEDTLPELRQLSGLTSKMLEHLELLLACGSPEQIARVQSVMLESVGTLQEHSRRLWKCLSNELRGLSKEEKRDTLTDKDSAALLRQSIFNEKPPPRVKKNDSRTLTTNGSAQTSLSSQCSRIKYRKEPPDSFKEDNVKVFPDDSSS